MPTRSLAPLVSLVLATAVASVAAGGGCAEIFGVKPGNPEPADAGRDGGGAADGAPPTWSPDAASACQTLQDCERLASDGRDGNVTFSTELDMNSASAGAASDANGTFPDGIAYRVASAPVGAAIDVGAPALGFAIGDTALVIVLQAAPSDDASVGNYEIVEVTDVVGTALRLASPLVKDYSGLDFANQRVVVQRIPRYGEVTVTGTAVITAGAWDGLTTAPQPVKTGIVAFYARRITLEAGARIDVRGLGHEGGETLGSRPESCLGALTANGDRGDNGGPGSTTGGHSAGGAGGAGGGETPGGAAGSSSDDGAIGTTSGPVATGGGGAGGSFLGGGLYPGSGGPGREAGGGGGGRNDNTTSLFGGGGGGGKPLAYGSREETTRTDAECKRMTLSAGAPAGAGGGARGGRDFFGVGGEPNAGTPGGRGAGIILLRAARIAGASPSQLLADGEAGGDALDGESSAIVAASDAQSGGGGGAGAQGATGGSICITASELALAESSLSAKGGRGGTGGSGGAATTDGAIGPGGAGGAGAPFVVGNDKGVPGQGGTHFTSGSGGGGGGGNSGWAGTVFVGPLL